MLESFSSRCSSTRLFIGTNLCCSKNGSSQAPRIPRPVPPQRDSRGLTHAARERSRDSPTQSSPPVSVQHATSVTLNERFCWGDGAQTITRCWAFTRRESSRLDIDHQKWAHPTTNEAWDLQLRIVPTFAMEANSLCGRKGSSFKICTTSGRSSRQTWND